MTTDCIERCGNRAQPGKARCRACEAARQRKRNASPQRRALYGGTWRAVSREIREETPWCMVCGTDQDLTVDHPTRLVFCRSHHDAMEARRRAARKVSA